MPKFGWKAVYEDSTIYRQHIYDKKGKLESEGDSYALVEEKGMPLYFFVGSGYGVNLKTGELLIKRVWQQFCDLNGEALHPDGLIYFRRRHAIMNLDGTWTTTPEILHVVGFTHKKLDQFYRLHTGVVRLLIPHDGRPPFVSVGDKLEITERQPVRRK
ncbi:MAG: hypothetical protein ACWGQW_00320 [bacterium]